MPRQQEDPPITYISPLTFGLEVAFFAAIKLNTFQEVPHPSISCLLGDRLRQVHVNGPRGSGVKFKVISEYPYTDIEEYAVDYKYWNIITCPTAAASNPLWFSDYESQPVEFISPPYFLHSSKWETDIQRVFSSRPGQFNPIPVRELRLYYELNSSSSFHVHIGNGVEPTSGFSFDTVRNLAMILIIYEPEIDKLLDGFEFYFSPFDKPPRSVSPTQNPHFKPPNLPRSAPRTIKALHLYKTCHDIESIVEAMSPPFEGPNDSIPCRYYKYNFTSLLDSLDAPLPSEDESSGEADCTQPMPKRKQPTFEFRRNPGTLDPETMIHWVKFLGALVDLAGKITTQALIEFLGLEDLTIIYHTSLSAAPIAPKGEKRSRATYILPNSGSPPSLSGFSLLSGLQPVGSFARLLTAMETAHIPLDAEANRHWRRKTGTDPI